MHQNVKNYIKKWIELHSINEGTADEKSKYNLESLETNNKNTQY